MNEPFKLLNDIGEHIVNPSENASVWGMTIIMGLFLESSKLIIATYLHNQWKNIYFGLKKLMMLNLIFIEIKHFIKRIFGICLFT